MKKGSQEVQLTIDPEGHMYETPLLARYGTFRELTLNHPPSNAKRPLVNDLATVDGPGDNVGCNPLSQPWSHAGCHSA